MPPASSWEAHLEDLLLYLRASGRAARTIADYNYHIRRFFRAHPDAWPDNLRTATLAFFGALGEEVAPATFNIPRQYLRAYFDWCVDAGAIPANPIASLPKRKDEAKIRAIPTAIIVELLDLPDKSTFAGLRDYALILTQLDTGLRPGEALGLLPAHVELPSTQLTVPAAKAKTRTSRTLPICQATAEAIGALLGARHPEWGPSVPIFCSADGRQLLVGSWSRRLRRLGEELDYTCRPYDLRHTFALEFLRGGGNVFALQRIMGHADLAMTKRYLALVDADLADQHALASPVARLIPRTHRLRRLSR